jgi:hypothetical protein
LTEPAGESPKAAGAPATQPQAIATAIDQARSKAIEAAKAALDGYKQADSDLNRLWALHTKIAAVHYFLATLGDDPQKNRADALREYQMAIKDRAERPEAREYRPIIEALSASAQQP